MVKVKVYTKTFCPYCIRAKMLLKSMKQEFEEVTVNDSDIAKLAEETGMMTVPQIFIGEKLVGGYDQLSELKDSGKLAEMLK